MLSCAIAASGTGAALATTLRALTPPGAPIMRNGVSNLFQRVYYDISVLRQLLPSLTNKSVSDGSGQVHETTGLKPGAGPFFGLQPHRLLIQI
ncbi:MAG: hypothetical protein DRI40_02305 [Chloroflexi bacterium]|nr:MAG: hypothetical protein DRI40_02305 [Chloroflexota bacterium]